MHRLLSLLTISALAAAVVGGTYAVYFDVETSRGNTFAAGDVDLKIDHTVAVYNGYQCVSEGCVVDRSENFVENGGFELPVVDGGWDVFDSDGDADDVPAWQVSWESTETSFEGATRPVDALLELHRTAVTPHDSGEQHAELDADWNGPDAPGPNNEPAQVRIRQGVPTVPGQAYVLEFAFSPRGGSGENILAVQLGGGVLVDDAISRTGGTNWETFTYNFVATSTITWLEFADISPEADGKGVLLDSVGVFTEECGIGVYDGDPQANQCQLWESRDLTGERFFTLEDVKPGDWGSHAISFTVTSNPSWTCLVAFDGVDAENSHLEMEEADGDASPGAGELSGAITLFGWDDENEDGVRDPGEAKLFEESLADFTGFAFHDSVATPGDPQQPGETEYLGLYWCLGDVVEDSDTEALSCDGTVLDNQSQTDSYVGSVGGYAQQWVNNQDFSCAELAAEDIE